MKQYRVCSIVIKNLYHIVPIEGIQKELKKLGHFLHFMA